jgi:uncharacterized membrane protein
LDKVDVGGGKVSVCSRQAAVHGREADWRPLAIWWGILLGATSVAIFSMRYALPNPPLFLKEMKNHFLFPRELSLHAIAGSIALMVGPWQLSASLRATHPRVHRWLGRVYVADVLVAWLLAVFLTPTVTTGFPAASAFFTIGLLWMGFMVLGVFAIRRHDIQAHRRWMLRSYAMAFTAVTIRFYFHPAKALGISFEHIYAASLWLSFLTNIVVIESALRWPQVRRTVIGPRA